MMDPVVSAIKELDRRTRLLAERTSDRTLNDRQSQNQRRDTVMDMYGVEIQRYGDTNNPAIFRIPITKDLKYYHRFEFSIEIIPFTMPIAGAGTSAASLSVSLPSTTGQRTLNTDGSVIAPNPHNHNIPDVAEVSPNPHVHGIVAGVSITPSVATDFEVWIEDIDITPFLKAQTPGEWIDGEGLFPSDHLKNYDVLEVIGHLYPWQQGVLLTPGKKKVELRGKGVFNAVLTNYLKLSYPNL